MLTKAYECLMITLRSMRIGHEWHSQTHLLYIRSGVRAVLVFFFFFFSSLKALGSQGELIVY